MALGSRSVLGGANAWKFYLESLNDGCIWGYISGTIVEMNTYAKVRAISKVA